MPLSDATLISVKNPLELVQDWLNQAFKNPLIKEPSAMTVSTVSPTGEISSRVVLLKQLTQHGLIFFTNYDSRKGRDLFANNNIAATLFWEPMARQINISGHVKKTSREVSVAYWKQRPRDSQLSQWISQQSKPVANRLKLEELVAEAKITFEGKDIPCPENWGGFLILPSSIEFWLGQPNRLHDRFLFQLDGSNWNSQRLYP